MKLSSVLSTVNQFEKSKFINFLDRICTEASSHDKEVAKQFKNIDGQIKNASSGEVINYLSHLVVISKKLNRN